MFILRQSELGKYIQELVNNYNYNSFDDCPIFVKNKLLCDAIYHFGPKLLDIFDNSTLNNLLISIIKNSDREENSIAYRNIYDYFEEDFEDIFKDIKKNH